jgi:DNA-binding NarL/FixJ family response regulator
MRPIRILLADDHHLVRAGLRELLEKIEGVEVVAEAGDGREALRLVEKCRPDLVFMDILMPEMNGLEAAARVASKFPETRVVMLSMNTSQEFVLQALQAGAAGYLLKNISPSELETAVKAVARGETHLSSGIARHVIEAYLSRKDRRAGLLAQLTPRQREVLQLIAEGNSTKVIAKKLGIAVKTADTYRTELMESLDIHDVAGLTRYAIRMGLVSPEN